MIHVGTAGWTVPRVVSDRFQGAGSQLERYSRVLGGVEINSSFYRPHERGTYARWAAAAPRAFRFAVKLPREITHELGLRRARRPLEQFMAQVAGLGAKLGPLLVQLPGSLDFDARGARAFLCQLRRLHEGAVAIEPRHPAWFEARAEALMVEFRVARVAADPARVPAAALPGGWPGLTYYRLHGSPRMYWSVYEAPRIEAWAAALRDHARQGAAWCIFDNTAAGGAAHNALQLQEALRQPAGSTRSRAARAGNPRRPSGRAAPLSGV